CRLQHPRWVAVRHPRPPAARRRPGDGWRRRVRDRRNGRPPRGAGPARRTRGPRVKLRTSIAPIPPGALDIAGAAVRRRRQLESRMLERLEQAGYEEIIPPTFEYAEVFMRAGGPEIADRLIRFLDLDGQLLALRYDFTASVARLAATKLSDRSTPLRLCYTGTVFRQDPEREGRRPRETLQAGGELLGAADVAADVEVLRL